jgi:hypothetical protein
MTVFVVVPGDSSWPSILIGVSGSIGVILSEDLLCMRTNFLLAVFKILYLLSVNSLSVDL